MKKDQRKGVTLGEAVQEYADPRRLEESDQYGGYDREWRSRPPPYIFSTEGPLPPEANAADRRERLWADMEEDLWCLLENGKLALWGYPHPLRPKSGRVRVVTRLLPLLKPNFENSTAEGGGLSLEDARVYPPDVVPGDAEMGHEAPEIPSKARPAAAPIADEAITRERRGRKQKYDSDEFMAELTRIIHNEGFPRTQTELEQKLLQWCENTWGEQPSIGWVRPKISKVYRKLRPDQ